MLDHPDIKAVSFVGSNAAGRYISERASANGKRVQASVGLCHITLLLNALLLSASTVLCTQWFPYW